MADVDPERLAKLGSRFPGVLTCRDWHEVLLHPDVRGVVVATPAPTHAEIAAQCLEAGKDVLVEKPLATSVSEAERLVHIAHATGAILMVGHVLEYHPAVSALRRLVAEGALGKIRYLYSNRLNLGTVRTEENTLWSFAPHDIALLLRLIGTMPETVAARGGEYLNSGVADVTLMDLKFPASVMAHVFVSWLHPFKEHRFVVVGDRQMAVFDDVLPWSEKLLLYPHAVDWIAGKKPVARRADATPIALQAVEPLIEEGLAFLRAIESREAPLTDGVSGIRVLEVLDAAQRSLDREGQPMAISALPLERRLEVHPTSIVSDAADVGEGTRIWHFCHVMEGARIGRDCILGQNVFVGRAARIGDGVKIQNNVSVYDEVVLEDRVFCGPSVVFTNVRNPRSEIDRSSEFVPTVVRQGATLGANATIVCGTTIGRYAFVGAGAVVTEDVPDYALVIGVPARQAGWTCECGCRLRLDSAGATCSECGRSYVLAAGRLIEQAN
jgi:UDP-2-acetamido-3-amino-2,3-dideoxy-glucuronate N-acetyltransferase